MSTVLKPEKNSIQFFRCLGYFSVKERASVYMTVHKSGKADCHQDLTDLPRSQKSSSVV